MDQKLLDRSQTILVKGNLLLLAALPLPYQHISTLVKNSFKSKTSLHLSFAQSYCWRVSHSVTHKHELWIWFTLSYAMMKSLLRLAAVRDTKQAGELRGDTAQFMYNDAKRQHLSTINTNSDLSFTTIQQQPHRRKQLMDQADDNSLTALLTKRDQVRFREVVNTCTERRAEKRIQRTAWILSHVLRKTLCEHVNGLCAVGWLNEQSITKQWFQSVRTRPYSWATGRNTIPNCQLFFDASVLCLSTKIFV